MYTKVLSILSHQEDTIKKTTLRFHLSPEWLQSRNQKLSNAGKGMEQKQIVNTAGQNAIIPETMEVSIKVPQNSETAMYGSIIKLQGFHLKETKATYKRCLNIHAYYCSIHDSHNR